MKKIQIITIYALITSYNFIIIAFIILEIKKKDCFININGI